MSVATMVEHPLIAAALDDEGLMFMGLEERLEAGQSFTYGGAPREGLIMKVVVDARPDEIKITYHTQQGIKVTVTARFDGVVVVMLPGLMPETYANSIAGQMLGDIVVLPGGDGLKIDSVFPTETGLTVSIG